MFWKKIIQILIFLSVAVTVFANETADTTNDTDKKLTYTVQRRFSGKSTLDVKDFYFYLGDNEISFDQFKTLTNDPLIAKTDKMLKQTIVYGSVCGSIFGLTFLGSVIPASVMITSANMETFGGEKYLLSGIAMFAIATASMVGIIIDIIAATTVYHKYRYNEEIIRTVVDRYNKKIGSVKVQPDISYNNSDGFGLNLRIKI